MAFKMKGSPMKRNFGIGASPLKQGFDPNIGKRFRTLTDVDSPNPPTSVKSKYYKSTSRFGPGVAKYTTAKTGKLKTGTGKVKPVSLSKTIKGVGKRSLIGLGLIGAYEGGKWIYKKIKESKEKRKNK